MSHPVNENAVRPEQGNAGPLKTALVTLLILLIGVALVWLIFLSEPSATRKGAARETAMLVDVQPVQPGRFSPVIEVLGQVVPAREVMLRSRVAGEIIEQAGIFTPGHRVSEGQELLRIDPADYRIALQQRQSELQQAMADLELEQGSQTVAQQEFELLGEEIGAGNQALILRKPQLDQARARVESARAAVRQAELSLARTRINAPFAAQILSRDVTLGSQIGSGETLGRLVGTDEYWVDATVPLSKLPWLNFDTESGNTGAQVTLYHDTAWRDGQSRQGRLGQLVGELESDARMARVIITVDDPLALEQNNRLPPLILGTFVRAEIEGRALDNVVRLERNLIRRNNTVWVMADRKLAIREVEIAFRDRDYAYVSSGLGSGDLVITSNLASVVEGTRLRLEDDSQ